MSNLTDDEIISKFLLDNQKKSDLIFETYLTDRFKISHKHAVFIVDRMKSEELIIVNEDNHYPIEHRAGRFSPKAFSIIKVFGSYLKYSIEIEKNENQNRIKNQLDYRLKKYQYYTFWPIFIIAIIELIIIIFTFTTP